MTVGSVRSDLSVVVERDPAGGPASAGPPPPRRARGILPEVQALRALAVTLVILYHLWPGTVRAGYVGVDVFFVISGFLITGQIVRDLEQGSFGLGRFYLRRARRLLPASMLVLLVVSVATVAVVPTTLWADTARQVVGSAFYVQNWVLSEQRIDYLTPDLVPTAVQHFWSLSVEEQSTWPARCCC